MICCLHGGQNAWSKRAFTRFMAGLLHGLGLGVVLELVHGLELCVRLVHHCAGCVREPMISA